MLKVILSVCAIISSIIAVTVYTTTLPATQKQVEENAEAIAYNSTYIETVDNALENLQDAFDGLDNRVETLEGKKLYLHKLYIRIASSFKVYCLVYNTSSTSYTWDTFKTYLQTSTAPMCYGVADISGTEVTVIAISYYQGNYLLYYGVGSSSLTIPSTGVSLTDNVTQLI